MKYRIVSLGIAILLLLMTLSGCVDKSKWRAKDYGGPPDWRDDMGKIDYGA